MDSTTLYLILALGGFLFVAIVMIHHHNCSDEVRMKRGELEGVTQRLQPRIEVLEKEVIEIKNKIEEVEEEITTYQ